MIEEKIILHIKTSLKKQLEQIAPKAHNVSIISSIYSEFNRVVFLKLDTKYLVLKIFKNYNNYISEWNNLSKVCNLNIAPDIYLKGSLNKFHFFLTEKIEGHTLDKKQIVSNWSKIIDNLNIMAALEIESKPEADNQQACFSFAMQFKVYVTNLLLEHKNALEEYNLKAILKIDAIINNQKKLFSNCKIVLGHTDLQGRNMILTPKGIVKFVDWEHSKYCDPAFEMSKLLQYNDLSVGFLEMSDYELLNSDKHFTQRVLFYNEFSTLSNLIWSYIRLNKFKNKQLNNHKETCLKFYLDNVDQCERNFQNSVFKYDCFI